MITQLAHRIAPFVAIVTLIAAMGGSWIAAGDASAAPPAQAIANKTAAAPSDDPPPRTTKKQVTGKLNLNTASEEQLMMLPTVGPAKAERVVEWRKKNGGFKRIADLRRVKGFGYKTFKRLEPYLDIRGETTLTPKK